MPLPAAISVSAYHWGGLTVDGERQYILHPKQSQAFASPARFVACFAGTGGGKSALGPLWLMAEIAKRPHLNYGVYAPTDKILHRETAVTLCKTFANTDFEGEYSESKNRYVLPWGSSIWVQSVYNEDGIEGGQIGGAWLDEAGQMSQKAWEHVQGRLGFHQGRALFTTTPYAMNWCKSQILARHLAGDPNYFAVAWSSIDNPAYPRAEYERAKRTMAKHRFEMRYDGLFTTAEGQVYPEFAAALVEPPATIPAGELIGGIQWRVGAPFAAVAGVHRPGPDGGRLEIFYERYRSGLTIEDHAGRLPAGVTWYADPDAPGLQLELLKRGLAVCPANGDMLTGIDEVTAMLKTGRLAVSKSCRALAAEAEDYRYPEGGFGELPAQGFDSALNALRFAVKGLADAA